MAFTTPTYILFLAIVFVLYWSFRKRDVQNTLLMIASYLLYLTWDHRFGALLFTTSLWDYTVGRKLDSSRRNGVRRLLLAASILGNIGALVLFKYFNFFSESFRLLVQSLGWRTDPVLIRVLLPVGLSFYTLKSLSYVIDVYRGQIKPTRNLVAYLSYVAFFPQLMAGPIDRASNLLRQILKPREFNYPLTVDGCRQILWGLAKKMLIADNLLPLVNRVFSDPSATPGPHLALGAVLFAFQIYCDFSAYSDIAIGSGKLLGFESVRNFLYPYFSKSPAEFWRRWHISLMNWFRDYVYFPLAGTSTSKLRRAAALLITFLLSGLWHGASANFVVWGGINGIAVLPALLLGRRKLAQPKDKSNASLNSPSDALKLLLTFSFTCLALIFFRGPTLSDATLILKRSFLDALNIQHYLSSAAVLRPFPGSAIDGWKIVILLAAFVTIEWVKSEREHPLTLDNWPRVLRWLAYTALMSLILYFGARNIRGFYYFQF